MHKHLASRRSVLTGTLAAGAAIAAPNIARAQPSVLWRVQSHWPTASASFTDSLVITSDLLTERTGGRFKLQLFGSGEIFKGAEIFNAVRSGVVEMGARLPPTSRRRGRKPWERLPESSIRRCKAAFSTARIGGPRRARPA